MGRELRRLADLVDAGETGDFTMTCERTPNTFHGGFDNWHLTSPAHPVTRIEIHHKAIPEETNSV